MNTTKIVFLGAGSASFGLAMFRDLFSSAVLAGSILALVDLNPNTLERMTHLAHHMNKASAAGLKIEAFTDRRQALLGADFVVNAVAIDRNRLWKHDFEIPRKYGIRHTLGENGGPGGLFFTLRTIPLVLDITRDMEEICPEALFINFSNPESRIILAVRKYTRIRAVGLCHGVFMSQADVAKIMELPIDQVDVRAAGLNHFQWLLHIRERQSRQDLYPLLRQLEREYDPTFMPLTRRLFRAFGYWPTCSDDHLGEYLAYGWEAGEDGYDFAEDEAGRVDLQHQIEAVLAGEMDLPEQWRQSSGERGVDVIAGILHNQLRFIESGVVYNQGVIPNLPQELAVEVPLMVDGAGVHPLSLGPLPDPIAKLLATQAGVQQLSVEAAVRGSKELALQALLIDPVVNSSAAAEVILDELWELNKPYIRNCI